MPVIIAGGIPTKTPPIIAKGNITSLAGFIPKNIKNITTPVAGPTSINNSKFSIVIRNIFITLTIKLS